LGGIAAFAAAVVSTSAEAASVFPERGFLRSGFISFATPSHSARSSSLKARLRRGDGGDSVIEVEDGRFIGRGDNG
jgi:hypothetical protein